MGGNALKHVGVIRATTDIMNQIFKELQLIFKDVMNLYNVFHVKNKITHGDIDVLVELLTNEDTMTLLKRIYNPKHIVGSGSLISFAIEYNNNLYQVDFITTSNILRDQFYLSYGITGAIIGRMTSRNDLTYDGGIKLQVSGQLLNIICKQNMFHDRDMHGNIRLTSNPDEACKILDLDYERWLKGFDTDNDLFTWLSNCRLFKKSHYNRIDTDKARYQMIDWIAFIKDIDDKPSFDTCQYVINNFDIKDRLLEIIENEHIKRNIKSKFSAHMIMNKGVTGTNIGKCIKYIQDIYGSKSNFESWIYENDEEIVHNTCNMHIDEFIANAVK